MIVYIPTSLKLSAIFLVVLFTVSSSCSFIILVFHFNDFIDSLGFAGKIEESYLAFTLVPVMVYRNADENKEEAIKENRGKSGIYQ